MNCHVMMKQFAAIRYSSNPLLQENHVDEGIDVGNVDLTVTVHVGSRQSVNCQDGVDDRVDICNIDFTVAVHISDGRFGMIEGKVINIGSCRAGCHGDTEDGRLGGRQMKHPHGVDCALLGHVNGFVVINIIGPLPRIATIK